MIRADDRISDVLAGNENLIDVFTTLSPAFARLRNPGMRKVMSRLVTVRQAARLGGVELDTLLAHLNDQGQTSDADHNIVNQPAVPEVEVSKQPAALQGIPTQRIVTTDVRDELRAGREPFSIIMAALRSIPEGGALCVRATFEPVPLYAVMKKQGLTHWTERRADDDWMVWFYTEAVISSPSADASAGTNTPATHPAAPASDDARVSTGSRTSGTAENREAEDSVIVLDVRGLEPPEPMMRTLAALEGLPRGGTLLQINVRVPRFLLPLLDERGYTYEIREQDENLVRLFIRRGESPAI